MFLNCEAFRAFSTLGDPLVSRTILWSEKTWDRSGVRWRARELKDWSVFRAIKIRKKDMSMRNVCDLLSFLCKKSWEEAGSLAKQEARMLNNKLIIR